MSNFYSPIQIGRRTLLGLISAASSSGYPRSYRLLTRYAKGGIKPPPEIYFYPPPYVFSNNDVIASPLTVGADQITTLFPVIPAMDGVVLICTWAHLQVQPSSFDFSLPEHTLSYWLSHGKKVVLCVSSAGPLIEQVRGNDAALVNHAPSWALKKFDTYNVETTTIGHARGIARRETKAITSYPVYWDDRFLREISPLIAALGDRFDGHPAISYVRIGTGLVGEDSPGPFGVHAERAPGFNFLKWITYSRRMVTLYRRYFTRTSLELDLSYLPWSFAVGSAADRAATDEFVDYLIRAKIFLTFDGLQGAALDWLVTSERSIFPLARVMHYLNRARGLGHAVGLEAIGPVEVPKMQDIEAVASAFNELGSSRLVLFGTDAGAINYVMYGPNTANESTVKWMNGRPISIDTVGKRALRLLSRIGRTTEMNSGN